MKKSLFLFIIGWASFTFGAAIAAFMLVNPSNTTEFGIWGARGILLIWCIVTPIYFIQTARIALKAVNGS